MIATDWWHYYKNNLYLILKYHNYNAPTIILRYNETDTTKLRKEVECVVVHLQGLAMRVLHLLES